MGIRRLVGAKVEEALDLHCRTNRWPYHRFDPVALNGLQLGQDAALVVGSVLAIYEQPVETSSLHDTVAASDGPLAMGGHGRVAPPVDHHR